METERSNPIASQMQYVPITLEEEIFGSQYMDTLNSPDDGNTAKVTGSITLQTPPETCSLCNNSVLLSKLNEVNLEPIAKLTCVHTFHLKYIVNSLKENPDCFYCRRSIYSNDDNDDILHLQEKNFKVEKFLKELSLWPIVFTQLPDPENEKIENSSTPQMDFPKIHDKILKDEKNLEKQTRKMIYTKYEILDSYYLLEKALEDKSAELKSKNPFHSAQIILNKEIRYPMASQVISNESKLVNELPGNLRKGFTKLIRKIMPTPISMIQKIYREFVLNFKRYEIEMKSAKLIHDGAWKESKEDIKYMIKEILNVLKDIWNNSVFDPELVKILNERIYQSTIIVPVI
ncbi:9996_t:CDS:2 [Ambispora leptoticha]|uniref:9996_t:CDS:1 n=1 Tax=Ambispora leptoticha TaxID=144679 RepID=A0A9N9AHQ3_9GLOM|nr:9996_t:CDS:2 [Ambispora leptoticha]